MAIDDNALYGLTGAQVKELPERIEAVKGLAKELTAADYNYPTGNPTSVALWLLEPGIYTRSTADGVVVRYGTGASQTLANNENTVLVTGPTASGSKNYLVLASNNTVMKIAHSTSSGGEAESQIILNTGNVAQTTGTSTTNVMSQKAVTDAIAAIPTGGPTVLTTADYNWPTSNPTSVALWLLDNGIYVAESDSVNVSITYNKTGLGNGIALVKQLDNENPSRANIVVLKDDSSAIYYGMTADGRNASQYNLYATVAQTTGTSTTDAMSQNAVTSMVYADPSTKRRIRVGEGSTVNANYAVGVFGTASNLHSVAIGNGSWARGDSSIAIGLGSDTGSGVASSVALGAGSQCQYKGEVNIGSTNNYQAGYNNSNYRLLTGLYDGQSAHDAVTVSQVNSVIDNLNSALNTNIPHIGA